MQKIKKSNLARCTKTNQVDFKFPKYFLSILRDLRGVSLGHVHGNYIVSDLILPWER